MSQRPPLTDLFAPWFDDPEPDLWVTTGELSDLCGLGKHLEHHAKAVVKIAKQLNIQVWRNTVRHYPSGRGRTYYRLTMQDRDAIRKVRKLRAERGVRSNEIVLFLERNNEYLRDIIRLA